jgi:transglutaminase-like putative cysteine protease
MKLRISHRTAFRYESPISESHNELRLQPVSDERQDCRSFVVRIFPVTKLSHYIDFFLNRVHFFELSEPHAELSVESMSLVETTVPPAPSAHRQAAMAELAPLARTDVCYDFVQSSTLVTLNAEAWRAAQDAAGGIDEVLTAADAIMRHIHGSFTYDAAATTVQTRMDEALRLRRGVCQDYAHVMIGLCRSLKIPARYVSGYIFNGGGERALIGADATHAWCEVYLPEFGWHGLDPTNNKPADDHYVKVAVGRDYADVPPVRGTYRGSSAQAMEVKVSVVEEF